MKAQNQNLDPAVRVHVSLDYPREFVEKYGEDDVAATLKARLSELFPGLDGEVFEPQNVTVEVEQLI